jgi:hypothetical protein
LLATFLSDLLHGYILGFRAKIAALAGTCVLLLGSMATAQSSDDIALLTYPQNGAIQVDPTVQFAWSQISGAQVYYLYIGSAPGLKDVYDSGEITQTTLTVHLAIGTTYYARLYTEINNIWQHAPDVSFATVVPSKLLTPADQAQDLQRTVQFTWTAVPSASTYYLYVGTAPGTKDIIDSGEITATQLTRTFPAGRYYARIYTEISQFWYASPDVSFSVTGGSMLASPVNGAVDVDPYTNFSWQALAGATSYSLSVGTSPGASDVLATGPIAATSYQLGTPLQSNTTYYARLGTFENANWFYSNSSFTTGTGIAHLLSPTNGASNVDPFSKLFWTTVSDAQAYYVYVGSSQGLKDIYDSGEVQATSLAVPSIQANTQYFIRLHTEKNSRWYSLDYIFTTGSGIAQMVYPADRATNVDPALPFQWSSDPRAVGYQISIGTSAGANDIFDSGQISDTSIPVHIAAAGTYYIRLSTIRTDATRFVDSSFTLGDFIAHLINPGNQSLADPLAAFTWTTVPNAGAYYLTIGTSKGLRDVYDSGELSGASIMVSNLVSGHTYFARLYTYRSGFWYSSDSTFLAGKALASLTNPTDGATISPLERFSWSVPDFPVDGYYLVIGTAPGAHDVFDSGALRDTSVMPVGLDFDTTYYATISTLKNNVWYSVTSTFSTFAQSSMPNLSESRSEFYENIKGLTAAVRLMADAATNIAIPGTPLDTLLKQNGLTLASCSHYAQILTEQLATVGIRGRLRSISFTGTKYESHTPLEYYDPFLRKWAAVDPTFGILYFDPITQEGQSVEELQSLVSTNSFAAIHILYVTSLNDTILRQYYLDPLTLYLNVIPPDQDRLGSIQHSPLQFLKEVPIQETIGISDTYIYSFGNASEQMQVNEAGTPLVFTPIDETPFSRAVVLGDSWSLVSAPIDLKAYTLIRPVF